jgi:hypothetical protein
MGAQEEAAHPEMAALRDVMPIPRMATADELADAGFDSRQWSEQQIGSTVPDE